MKKIKFYIDLNHARTSRSEIIKFPEDATDEDINETYDIWVDAITNKYWNEVDDYGNEI